MKAVVELARRAVRFWVFANVFLVVALLIRLLVDTAGAGGVAGAVSLIAILLWDVLPLLGMLWLVRPRGRNSMPNPLMQLVVISISALGTCGCFIGFCFYPSDPQGPLALIFMPMFQWIGALTAFLLRGERKRDESKRTSQNGDAASYGNP